uniref:Tetraspanin-10 n=1 Tax=Cyclopterus lumpus TaxID=8103 RepID=A0A8C2ZR42_CYCLU
MKSRCSQQPEAKHRMVSPPQLTCSSYFLIISNLVFTVLGLLVLVLGMWGLISKQSFAQEKIGSIGTDPMLVFLTLGFVLTVLCLSGCVGALRENCTLLKLFSAAVLALITAQVLAAIVAYSLQVQVGGYLRSGMLAAMVRYQDDLDLRFITDEIQSNLQCCGADNYRDWELNIYYNCSAPGVLACGVPATCCVDPLENGTVWNSQCGLGAQLLDEFSAQSVIFLGGCLGGMSRWIEQHEGVRITWDGEYIHPSIIFCLSGPGSQGQQAQEGIPDNPCMNVLCSDIFLRVLTAIGSPHTGCIPPKSRLVFMEANFRIKRENVQSVLFGW